MIFHYVCAKIKNFKESNIFLVPKILDKGHSTRVTVEERSSKTEIRLVLSLTQPCGSIAKIKPLTKGLLLLFHDIFSTCDLLTEMWQWGVGRQMPKCCFLMHKRP